MDTKLAEHPEYGKLTTIYISTEINKQRKYLEFSVNCGISVNLSTFVLLLAMVASIQNTSVLKRKLSGPVF